MGKSKPLWLLLGLVLGLALVGVALAQGPGAQESKSTSYVIQVSVLDGGGEAASGTNVILNGSVGQPSTVVTSAGSSEVVWSGYWQIATTNVYTEARNIYLPVVLKLYVTP